MALALCFTADPSVAWLLMELQLNFNLPSKYRSSFKFLCRFKVTGNSLLIHAFPYSLFFGLFSVTSNMTGYSHSYLSIKLIHCGTPQRDVLCDKMVL